MITPAAIGDDLWRRLSTDKASCLNRNCHYYRECPFFVARREIQEAEVVVANHALVMAALESEAVLPEPKTCCWCSMKVIICPTWRGMRWR